MLDRWGPVGIALRTLERSIRQRRAPVDSMLHPVVVGLLREIVAAESRPPLLVDNVDRVRFTTGYDGPPPEETVTRLQELLSHAEGLAKLHDRLEVPADRELLAKVLAFRVLGPRKMRLPLSPERLRLHVSRAESARTAERTAAVGLLDMYGDDYDLHELGYPIRLRAPLNSVVQDYLVQQYRCVGQPEISVRPGDVVVDGGGWWGDTALYLALLAGEHGRVISYEFEPANLEVLQHNLQLNPGLAPRIEIIQSPLWDRAGEELSIKSAGWSTTVGSEGERTILTDTVDALVARGQVDRVDFIKLDIEGAEMNALRGAEQTLRRFRPRLAVAAYHKLDDLSVIPKYLDELGVGYRFRVGHTTMHHEETVLFAHADDGAGASPPGATAATG